MCVTLASNEAAVPVVYGSVTSRLPSPKLQVTSSGSPSESCIITENEVGSSCCASYEAASPVSNIGTPVGSRSNHSHGRLEMTVLPEWSSQLPQPWKRAVENP